MNTRTIFRQWIAAVIVMVCVLAAAVGIVWLFFNQHYVAATILSILVGATAFTFGTWLVEP